MANLERWLRRAGRNTQVPAIILGGSFTSLSFARSLGRRGVPVLQLGGHPSPGGNSRYAHVVRLPSAHASPERWIELLEQIGSRLPARGVLLPLGDAQTLLVARHREALQRHFRFLLPTTEAVAGIVDKRAQYRTADAAGIPLPAVHFPDSVDEASEVSGRVPYPCLLKPHVSHTAHRMGGRKVLVVGSPAELVSAYERMSAAGVPLMVQEIVPGGETALHTYTAFWDGEGRELAWVTKRKLRQFPPQFGNGTLQVTVEAPEIAELSRRLLRAFDYRGFVGVEFKLSASDGGPRLIEINPRVVSGNELAVAAGVDLPWIGYRHLTGADAPAASFRPGVKFVNEEWDLQAFLALRRSGQLTVRSWLASLRGVRATAVWAWDDPLPFLARLRRLGRLRR